MALTLAAIDLEWPVTDPLLIVAIAFGVFLVAPALMERSRIPGMVGLILAGAVIGPHGLDILARDPTIVLLGTVGLLYLMFMAGVEIDLYGFLKHRNRSLLFGALTFAIPQAVGTGLGLWLGYSLPAAILLASLFASHTLIAYPIASRFGIAKTGAVTTAVGGTIFTDTAALLVLAVVAASTEGALTPAFWTRLVVGLTVYVAFVLLVLPRIGRWLFRHERAGATTEFLFVLTALFAGSFLAEVAGVEAIVGAFLVGLSLNRLIPEHGPLSNRIQFVGEAVFIPFFLLSVGMLLDARVLLGGARVWQVMLAMTITVVGTKWLAAKITERIFGYTREEGWTIFGLTVCQAAATLAATLVGYEIGLFDDAVLNGAILMILVTAILGPWVVARYGRLVARHEEQRAPEPSGAPQRILVPLANPATADALVDLALAIRDPDSPEPIFPLTVVPPEEDPSAGPVAAAERMLAHAVAYAAAVDVRAVPMIRVDHNVASGIVRGAVEGRTAAIVIGWDATAPRRRGIFGGVLDQLLEDTREQVLVARLAQPLNTTGRIVVIVPRDAERMPGFLETVRVVKLLANRLGAAVLGLAVGSSPEEHADRFSRVKPDAPSTFLASAGWDSLPRELSELLLPDDLVVVLGARKGAIAWDPALERLPAELARTVPGSFVMAYASEALSERRPVREDAALPHGLLPPERMVRLLPPLSFEQAVRRILASGLGQDPARLEEVAAMLIRQEREISGEVRPGVVLLHGHLDRLPAPMLFLGASPDGVDFPGASGPANAIFILLSPEDRPEEHLRAMAAVARFVSDPERLGTLLEQPVRVG